MSFENIEAVVLAAGKSKRFKTGKSKLVEKICGKEIILFSTKLLEQMKIDTTLVVGHQKEVIQQLVKKHHKKINFVEQKEQLGTGHAIAITKDILKKENILILNGDVPLVTEEIIEDLYKKHTSSDATISFVVSHCESPDHSYGRVIKNKQGIKIVEAKDFDPKIHEDHCCINAGIYIAKTQFLKDCIDTIEKNKSNEFYLTDLVEIASKTNLNVETAQASLNLVRGVNTLEELWAAEQIKRSELIKYWMSHGVRFNVAQAIHIDIDIQIGNGTQIGCAVHLLGKTKIGKNCIIKKFTTIENSTLEDNVEIHPNCVIRDSYISKDAQIGPFANIHSQTKIEQGVNIGNFVEIKTSKIGKFTFARHHSYLGNATLGSRVNIGAGTITCNYDGITKHETTIKDNAYIGSNNTLVAPLTIEKNAFTAAGSTITEDVPTNCLAIGRSQQINKENYVEKLYEKLKTRSLEINNDKKKTANLMNIKKENTSKIQEL